MTDKFLVYSIDENNQTIFKTSQEKMMIAMKLDCDSNSYLSNEFCCFDGMVNRTKSFTTLTASIYNPLLQKQIPLAIMECRSEDSHNIEIFWRKFNEAYRESNGVLGKN